MRGRAVDPKPESGLPVWFQGRIRPGVICLWLALSFAQACDQADLCPPTLRSVVSPTDGGFHWGGDTARITGKVKLVASECLPVDVPARQTRDIKRSAMRTYTIASTASIDYQILDSAFVNDAPPGALHATLIFEALSSAGVVLDSSSGTFEVVRRDNHASVSAQITDLTSEEIKRVREISVRWAYSH